VKQVLHIVSHSHWDREWHHTFQQFRLRLVKLVDDVLTAMATGEPQFTAFMLDAQTVVLEDYLEVRPERAEDLRNWIRAGRILVGPWYVHPDEFLVSGEAIVRNLLLGTRIARNYGSCMSVGYVPDQFGHIAQLPQIFRGFAIDNAVLWRGVERAAAGTAFDWHGAGGASVLVAALPDGYGQAGWLPEGEQALADRLRTLARSQAPLAPERSPLLVMNGGDHLGIQSGLPKMLDAARKLLADEYVVRHSTLPAYVAELRQAAVPRPILKGELRSSRDAFLLPGVTSTRMWIKQRNAQAQSLLERFAEPLATIAAALGSSYPAGELRQSWKYLLQNQPHDSICGCSIDQVHQEMTTRYDWSEQIAQAVGDGAFATLAARIDSVLPGAEDPLTLAITVFNGAASAQAGRIDLHLRLAGESASYELVDEGGNPVPHTWIGERGEAPTVVELPATELPDLETMMAQLEGNRVFGLGFSDVSMRTIGDALHVEVTTSEQAILSREQLEQAGRDAFALIESAGCSRAVATVHRSAELHLAALTPEVPALGYLTLFLRPRKHGTRKHADSSGLGLRAGPGAGYPESEREPQRAAPELLPMIRNEHYRVEMDPASGGLTVTELASGVAFGPFNVFVDGGDAGDLYTFCPPGRDTTVTTSSGSTLPDVGRESDQLGERLSIRYMLRVPKTLAESRWERQSEHIDLPISTTVTLAPGDRLIRFQTTVENSALDHRLRVHMTLPFAADHAHAEQAFCLVRRVAQPDRGGDWVEQPIGTAPHQGVVAVHGNGRSVVLAAHGLPEYEVVERTPQASELALTLLRCTGWLSRDDLQTRKGGAGPSLPTPEAQCLGAQSFAYALACGDRPWRELVPFARALAVPLRFNVGPCAEGMLPATGALVTARPATIVLSAFKGAEDGRGAILRVYNDDVVSHTAQLSWCLPVRRATLVDLAETDGANLFDDEARDGVDIEVPADGIVSIRLEWA